MARYWLAVYCIFLFIEFRLVAAEYRLESLCLRYVSPPAYKNLRLLDVTSGGFGCIEVNRQFFLEIFRKYPRLVFERTIKLTGSHIDVSTRSSLTWFLI